MKKFKSIDEVKVVPKKKIGSGMEHDVYPSTNQDVVIKTPSSRFGKTLPKIRMSWVYLFQQHPDIFPKVIKVSEKYVVLEKLDTNKAMSEYLTLDGLLKEDRELWDGDFAYTLFLIHKESDEDKLAAIDQHFEMLGNKPFQLYSKWRNLILNFLDIMPHDYYSDLHVGQFGYSKDGTLKILDF
jgi:hypothetical protein